MYLKQSTSVTLKLGPFVDSTDGVTSETGLTIAQADVRLTKNGGDFAQKNEATSATHDENGWYDVPLNATDTNTLGILKVAVTKSGALPVWDNFIVLPANIYDSLVGGSDKLEVDTVQVSGDSTSADNLEADYDGTGYAKTNSTIGTCTTNTDMRGTDNAALASVCTEARLSELDAANLPADVSAILADTNELQGDWADGGRLDSILDARASQTSVDTIDGIVDSIKTETDKIALTDAGSGVTGSVIEEIENRSTFNAGSDQVIVATNNDKTGYTLSSAGVDAILDESITEPSGVFAWGSATLRNIIGWLGALSRNKITQTSSTQTLRNDADAGNISTSTTSDDGTTTTRGEWS